MDVMRENLILDARVERNGFLVSHPGSITPCGLKQCEVGSACRAFTLIELLVVVAILALLAGMLLPALGRAKALGAEKACASNLRQAGLVLMMYADDSGGHYPVEPTEHNPHPQLLSTLESYQPGVSRACYCPRASFMEKYAQDPSYVPKGATDSVMDTPQNRDVGNISYVYFSFLTNKCLGDATGADGYWREPGSFIPRRLTTTGVDWIYEDRPQLGGSLADRWVMSDFFRRGAPFPHTRNHAQGLNVNFLDGHVSLVRGSPKTMYR